MTAIEAAALRSRLWNEGWSRWLVFGSYLVSTDIGHHHPRVVA